MFTLVETTSPEHFRSQSALFIVEKIRTAQQNEGICIIGLSGGSTPKPVYEELGVSLQVLGVSFWEKVRLFLVDERYVPADHPESNQRMVRETMLRGFDHSLFPNTALPIADCIADYTLRLKALWKNRLPHLLILGMGNDGHIASLFPPLSDLALGDGRLVLHTQTESHPIRDRLTLSLNALAAADEQVLLLQGKDKQRTWEEMMASPEDERRWPLKRVMETGRLTVIQLPAPPSQESPARPPSMFRR